MIEQRLPYVVQRGGRPRWVPSPRLRRLGYRGQDLRHADGRWYSHDECREFVETRQLDIAARRGLGHAALVVPARRGRKVASHIYFLRCRDMIKIGYSTKPLSRIEGMRTALAGKVESLVIVEGTRRDEARLHAMLSAHRRTGEWFAATPAVVRAMVDTLLHRAPLKCAKDFPPELNPTSGA